MHTNDTPFPHVLPLKRRDARPIAERFWEKIDKSAANGCWEWHGAMTGGYGCFYLGHDAEGRNVRGVAHRVSYTLCNGLIPDGMWVLHHCDNHLCVNPDHLFLGTHQDNMDDMSRKRRSGRHTKPGSYGSNVRPPVKRGEDSNCVKLTEHDVIEIRQLHSDGLSTYAIGSKFGVTATNISFIVRRKTWKHVA